MLPQANGEVITRLTRWAGARPDVRAVLLTSSRAEGRADPLSDHDVMLVVDDPARWAADEAWQADFGPPLIRFRDQTDEFGQRVYARLVIYEDGTRIDYSLWPEAVLAQIAAGGALPGVLDMGYRALVDKDGLAAWLPPATGRAFIPARPTSDEYLAVVEEFWWESSYVAKYLWRDELLRRMLEWRVEIDHDWAWRPGVLGRGLKTCCPSWSGPLSSAPMPARPSMTTGGRCSRRSTCSAGPPSMSARRWATPTRMTSTTRWWLTWRTSRTWHTEPHPSRLHKLHTTPSKLLHMDCLSSGSKG